MAPTNHVELGTTELITMTREVFLKNHGYAIYSLKILHICPYATFIDTYLILYLIHPPV